VHKFPEFLQSSTESISEIARCNLGGGQGNIFLGGDARIVFWTCPRSHLSEPGINGFDEYVIVVEGCCTIIANGSSTAYGPDQQGGPDVHIQAGLRHSRQVIGARELFMYSAPQSR
jgi:hypothetical protein